MNAAPLDTSTVFAATPPAMYAHHAESLRGLLSAVLDADQLLADLRRRLLVEANASPLALLLPNGERLPLYDVRQVYPLVAALGLSPQAFAEAAPVFAAGLVAVNQREALLLEAVVQYSLTRHFRRSAPVDAQLRGLQRWLNMPGHAGTPPIAPRQRGAGQRHAVGGAE